MPKSDTLEVRRRIEKIADKMAEGATYGEVVNFCDQEWNIGRTQANAYMAKVKKAWDITRRQSFDDNLAKAIATKEMMWRKCWEQGDRLNARLAHKDLCELQGLQKDTVVPKTTNFNAPVQIIYEIANPSGESANGKKASNSKELLKTSTANPQNK